SIIADARAEALREAAGEPPEVVQQVMEYASIRRSVDNLETFPFAAAAIRSGSRQLHGAWFDISTGGLMSLDRASGRSDRGIWRASGLPAVIASDRRERGDPGPPPRRPPWIATALRASRRRPLT